MHTALGQLGQVELSIGFIVICFIVGVIVIYMAARISRTEINKSIQKDRERIADQLYAWSQEVRSAYKQHNKGRDLTLYAPRRPDLNYHADGLEAASHAVRRGKRPDRLG